MCPNVFPMMCLGGFELRRDVCATAGGEASKSVLAQNELETSNGSRPKTPLRLLVS